MAIGKIKQCQIMSGSPKVIFKIAFNERNKETKCQGEILARWYNRKTQTLLPLTDTDSNNKSLTNPLCEKSWNQLRGSCIPSQCENGHVKPGITLTNQVKFITLTHHSFSPQCSATQLGGNIQPLAFPWEEREDQTVRPSSDFSGWLPKELVSVLSESKHWQERAPVGRPLRTKAEVWTSRHSLVIGPHLLFSEEQVGKNLQFLVSPLGGKN